MFALPIKNRENKQSSIKSILNVKSNNDLSSHDIVSKVYHQQRKLKFFHQYRFLNFSDLRFPIHFNSFLIG